MSEKSFQERFLDEINNPKGFGAAMFGSQLLKEADAKLAEQAERIKILEGCNESLNDTKAALRERIKELEAENTTMRENILHVVEWFNVFNSDEAHLVDHGEALWFEKNLLKNIPRSLWTPASTPPENEVEVIVLCHNGFKLGCCIDGDWLESHDDTPLDEDFDVVAWMPIPEYTPAPFTVDLARDPFKAENEEEKSE